MRLIDADVFLKRFSVTEDGRKIPEVDCDNFEVTVSIKDVKAMVREQSTAYSVDKVVEELEKLQTYNMSLVTIMSDLQKNGVCRHYICLEDAIEIVKQGGVSDDVCEWKRDNMCETVYRVCGGCFTSAYQKDFKFCPYCGKKIKVVE